MNDVEFLADQLQRAYRGEAWHGPSLRETLAGVTSEQARAKPSAAVHNIWEIVMHVGAWICAVRRRLAGETLQLSPEQDWPAIDGGSDSAWQQTLAALWMRSRAGFTKRSAALRRRVPEEGSGRPGVLRPLHAGRRDPAQPVSRRPDRVAQKMV